MQNATLETSIETSTLSYLKELVIEITQLKIRPEMISDTANLFDDCGLDSVSVIDLVLSIEEKFGISISEDELDVSLFRRLSNLAEFIEVKRETQA